MLHSFTNTAWHSATLSFDRGGLGPSRSSDLRVAAYPGSVSAAAPNLIDVLSPSLCFLPLLLMEPSAMEVSYSLPMGSSLPEHLHPQPLLIRLRQASVVETRESHLQTEIHAVTRHLRAQHSLPAPDDFSEAAQCTRARIRSYGFSFSIAAFSTLPTWYNHARIHPALSLTMVKIRIDQPVSPVRTLYPKCSTLPGSTSP